MRTHWLVRSIFCLGILFSTSIHAQSVQQYRFDMPAQSLAVALDHYAIVTGKPVLFPSALVEGLVSSNLSGTYTAHTALQLLLANAGLIVEVINAGNVETYVLKLPDGMASATKDRHVQALALFDGQVQLRVWQALCANAETKPGHYRALLQFYVNTQGQLGQVALLSTSGQVERDAMIVNVLEQVRIDLALPKNLKQPYTMLFLPRDQIAGEVCEKGMP